MKRKIFSSFILTLLSSGLFFGFNFFIAKALGAVVYGEINYYLSFIQIVVLLISFNYAGLYMGEKITKENEDSFSLFFTIETLAFVILFIPLFFFISKFTNNYLISLLIMIIAYFLTIVGLIGLEFNSKKQIPFSILYSVLIPRINLIIIYLLFILLNLASAISYLFSYLFSLIIVATYFLSKFSPRIYFKKEIFQRAWKFYLLGIIGSSVTYIAQIFQKEFGSYEELASLAIGLLLISGLSLVGGILIKFALPKIHEAWKFKNIEKIEELYSTHTFLSSMINIPILIYLLFFIETLSIYIGDGYQYLPKIFYILSVGYLTDLLTGITGTILRATENEHIEIYNEIFRFVIAISLLFFLKETAFGIAYAISISMIVYNLVKFYQVYRLFGIKPIRKKNFFVLLLFSILLSLCFVGIFLLEFDKKLMIIISLFCMVVLYSYVFFYIKKSINLGIYT